ncbi:hypothetical protein Misp01_45540 [Microtetraspora sp. NBRC 13810]|uniref:CPBP family intramembrane glutamic endopeptidase n=1 Tax=Microtetraspora sp. NBRC 13810 TaxID=3030990 RepID=UPI0024A45061|nr:CPBP family intramembrane glutamic endopeptidase [Microtetraspora sp. NBRC 13810]GLW09425.1 hypothetical protein Misp01_45540 [Microtetraspora sp. NBRC 13810]
MKATKPLWATLITIAFLIAAVFGGIYLTAPLSDPANPVTGLYSSVATTLIALALVFGWRRFVTRQPWQGMSMPLTWAALPQALLGVAVGTVAILASNSLSVAFGAASWVPPEARSELVGYFPLTLAIVVLSVGFPDEVLFRGHLYGTLPARLALPVTTVAFGALHLISFGSEASEVVEGVLYVVSGVALGFACGAARARTGTVWMAVGVHTGTLIAFRLFATEGVVYGVQLAIQIATLALTGLLILATARRSALWNRTGTEARNG